MLFHGCGGESVSLYAGLESTLIPPRPPEEGEGEATPPLGGVGEALTNWGVMETPGLGYLECKGEQAALLDTLQGLVARHRPEP